MGQYSYLNSTILVSNGGFEKADKITTENLKYTLLSKGLNFNSHAKYFERIAYVLKGKVSEIPQELFSGMLLRFHYFLKAIYFQISR